MSSLSHDSRIYCPDNPYIIDLGNEYIYFSHVNNSGIRVNKSGALILNEIIPGEHLSELAQRFSMKVNLEYETILSKLTYFIDLMIKSGYVWLEGEYENIRYIPIYCSDFAPKQAYLHITSRCNLNCVYCYNSEIREPLAETDLPTNQMMTIIEKLKKFGIEELVFTGGEPLLRSDIFELASYVKALGMNVNLLTNGTLIKKIKAVELINSFDFIIISLDSSVQEEHDYLRGMGTHFVIANAIKELCSIDYRKVCIRPVITSYNCKSLQKMPYWASEKLGCRAIMPVKYIPRSLDRPIDIELFPDDTEIKISFNQFVAAAKESSIKNFPEYLPFCAVGKCGAGTYVISIDSCGNVFPCQSFHNPEFKAGNILVNSFDEIANSDAIKKIADLSVELVGKCSECNISYLCGGGCRAIAYSLYGDLYAYNERFCNILKNDAEDRLIRESLKNTKYDK